MGRTPTRKQLAKPKENRVKVAICLNVSLDGRSVCFQDRSAKVGGTIHLTEGEMGLPGIKQFFVEGRLRIINEVFEAKISLPGDSYACSSSQKIQVGFFTENSARQYSGGRYYAWMMAYALANIGHKVTIISDKVPVFTNDFISFPNSRNLEIIIDTGWGENIKNNYFDYVVGSPREGGIKAVEYGRKHNIPSCLLLFETPNYIRKYRDGGDSKDSYWVAYAAALKKASFIYPLAHIIKKYLLEWMPGLNPEKIIPLYPPINSIIADSVPATQARNEIVFCSRLIPFKQPDHILLALKDIPNPPALNIIGGVFNSGYVKKLKEMAREFHLKLIFHNKISDREKFKIIRASKLLVHPTKFEGYGIPPSEALYCGKPVVAYDNVEILKEVYKDHIDYGKAEDGPKGLSRAISKLLTDKTYYNKRSKEAVTFAKNQCSFDRFCSQSRNLFPPVFISACMIVLNEEEYIKYSLESIYDFADEIIIVEGAVKKAAFMSTTDGHSIDKTLSIIKSFPDPQNKIRLITKTGFWENKQEMRDKCIELMQGNYLFFVDGDEVYKKEDLKLLRKKVRQNPKIDVFHWEHNHFWKNFNLVATGSIWEMHLFRFCKKLPGMKHTKTHAMLSDTKGRTIWFNNDYYKPRSLCIKEISCYHFAYVKNQSSVENKLKFYKSRDGHSLKVVNTHANWLPGKPTQPTHGGGSAEAFKGDLPAVMKEHPYAK